MEEKKSFILYNDSINQIKLLSNEDAGAWIKAVFDYVNGNEINIEKDVVKMLFSVTKAHLDRDNDAWNEIKQKRSNAGRKGMESRWGSSDNNVISVNNKDNKAINDITKITVNVSDSVNVNENVNVSDTIKKDRRKKAPFVKPTVEEVRAYCQERKNNIDAEHFIDHYETNGWRVGKNPMKDWKASIRTWERNDYGFNNRTKSKTREYDPAELEYYSETSDF